MGQTQSHDLSDCAAPAGGGTSTARAELLAPIVTEDQFLARFRAHLSGMCLSPRERNWFHGIFEKFAQKDNLISYWTASDLVEFLSITFPDETKPLFFSAAPLLYRWILALGSFPYHNRPVGYLTLEILQIAVIVLLRRHESGARLLDSDDTETNIRILFQSLAQHADHIPETTEKSREELDDEDLHCAYVLVSRLNRTWDSNNPKRVRRGPEIPSMAQFPSSFSQNFTGRIPTEEFRSLLGILLSSQLYAKGIGPEMTPVSTSHFKEVIESVANAFQEGQAGDFEYPDGIGWYRFRHTMKYSTPNLFTALSRLLAPLISGGTTHHDTLDSISKSEVASAIRIAFKPPYQAQIPKSGSILNLPLLQQLAVFLPLENTFETSEVLYTVEAAELYAEHLMPHLQDNNKDIVLLLSGSTASDPKTIRVGAFFPRAELQEEDYDPLRPCLFQLHPVHEVFWSDSPRILRNDDSIAEGNDKGFRLNVELNTHTSLTLDQLTGAGALKTPAKDHLLEFQVKFIEVVSFPFDKFNPVRPKDPFYINPTGFLSHSE